jgi:hypothetical protein
MRSGRVQNEAERGAAATKSLEVSFYVWKPCNSLKFHKTTKAFFGKAWHWNHTYLEKLGKTLEVRLYFTAFTEAPW